MESAKIEVEAKVFYVVTGPLGNVLDSKESDIPNSVRVRALRMELAKLQETG